MADQYHLVTGARESNIQAIGAIEKTGGAGFHKGEQHQIGFVPLKAVDSTQRDFDPTFSQTELSGIGALFTHGLQAHT